MAIRHSANGKQLYRLLTNYNLHMPRRTRESGPLLHGLRTRPAGRLVSVCHLADCFMARWWFVKWYTTTYDASLSDLRYAAPEAKSDNFRSEVVALLQNVAACHPGQTPRIARAGSLTPPRVGPPAFHPVDRFASHDRTAGGGPNRPLTTYSLRRGQPYDTARSARVVGTDSAVPDQTDPSTDRILAHQASCPKHRKSTLPLPVVP
jgi:hypothetical protein